MSKFKQIKTTKQLPPWFKLSKYDGVRNFTAVDWYKALVQRQCIITAFRTRKLQDFEKYNSGFYKEGRLEIFDGVPIIEQSIYPVISDAMRVLRKDPKSVVKQETFTILTGNTDYAALVENDPRFPKFVNAISPLTLDKLYRYERFVKSEVRIPYRRYMDNRYDSPQNISEADEEFISKYVNVPFFDVLQTEGDLRPDWNKPYVRNRDMVEIDFSLPDRVLKRQFNAYLISTRKNYPELKPAYDPEKSDFKKWHMYGILPYLDLYIWELETRSIILNKVFAEAIWNDLGREELVRKQTQPKAHKYLKTESLHFLKVLAAEEMGKQKKSV